MLEDFIPTKVKNPIVIIIKIPDMHVGYICAVPTAPNATIPQNPIYQDKYYLINAPTNTTAQPSTSSNICKFTAF